MAGKRNNNIWRHVEVTDGCWLWRGRLNDGGYGHYNIYINGKPMTRKAHRLIYAELIGAIPEGLTLDHLCGNPPCVNPGHLEPVTMLENLRRGKLATINSAKTHCKYGHKFDKENTYFIKGNPRWRQCKACKIIRIKEWRIRNGISKSRN